MPRQDRVPPSIAPADAVSARLHRRWSSFRTALREMPGYHLRFRFSAPLEVRPTPSARTPPEAPDALSQPPGALSEGQVRQLCSGKFCKRGDRKSTRLNSSHVAISYAVFCLKKKKKRKVY